MTTPAEQHFMEEVLRGIAQLKREFGYNPSYFNQMVSELGPLDASRRLIRSKAVPDGFTKLWELSKLDMSVEALAILPWYVELFDDEERVLASRRLRDYGFDTEAFIARRRLVPPAWWRVGGPQQNP